MMNMMSTSYRSFAVGSKKKSASPRKIFLWTLFLSLIFGAFDMGEPLDMALQITRNRLRSHPVSGDIVIVAIDDKSLSEISTWPWPRRQHAALVERLSAYGTDEVFFDIDFSAASRPADDTIFAAALAKAGRKTTLGVRYITDPLSGQRTDYLPLSSFRTHVGLANINLDYNYMGAVLDVPFGFNHQGQQYPSMAAALVGKQGPIDKRFNIDYAIDPKTIPVVSAIDVIKDLVDPKRLAGKSILVTPTSMPVGEIYFAPGHKKLPGGYFHVLAAETLKAGDPRNIGWLAPFILACLLLLLVLRARSVRVSAAILVGAIVLFLAAPIGLDAYLISTGIAPSLILLIGGGGTFLWSRFKAVHRARGISNTISGLPNLNALREEGQTQRWDMVVAKIQNYDEVASSLPPEQEKVLVDQITARLTIGDTETRLYQGDGGVFIWFVEPAPEEEMGDHLNALHTLFRTPIKVAESQIDLVVSFGIEAEPDRSVSNRLGSALVAADAAAEEGLKWKKHEPASLEATKWKLSLLSQLDAALESGDVWVAYQPKLDLRTGTAIGAEALVRWTHPERGPISPIEFILEAEQKDRIENLTAFVLDQAVEVAAAINRRRPFEIAVNVSARLINNPLLIAMVKKALARHKLPPAKLTLEVTETAALATRTADIDPLQELLRMGVGLSIDDYGTGLSTLEYLKKVPATEIKIDRSFVHAFTSSQSDRLLVHSTIELAHSLGRIVVAEGIEDGETLDALTKIGCDIAQGYFIAKPMTSERLDAYLEEGTGRFHIASG